MKKRFSKTLLACALGLASVAAMAAPFNPFTVAEGSVPGAVANTFVADKITGNYDEVITFSGSAFNVSLLWNAGQFVDAGLPVANQLGAITANQYGLYALYQAAGTFATAGGITTFTTTPGGSLNVYIDPLSNTTFTAPGTGSTPWTTGATGDDYIIATGTALSGTGQLDPLLPTCGGGGINCGSFGTETSFGLTAAGSSFFTLPLPFYNLSFQSGQLDTFLLTGTQTITGSLDATFATPEPGTVVLIGLGLLGLCLGRRKSAK